MLRRALQIGRLARYERVMLISRRTVIASAAFLALAAPARAARDTGESDWSVGKIPDQPYDIDIVNIRKIPPAYRRQDVAYDGPEAPGTIIVDAAHRFIYWIAGPGRAIRFGVAVGREGATWRGVAVVGRKAKWPSWTPTANMRRRNPKLPAQVRGGPDNPLGARALYLYRDGVDTLYRIHGTNEPWSIGKAASSGCIRMLNEDVFELYGSVPIGARVIVR
jgi:lipoprotein-anchoring transpeptidase ErfK/SrfK